MYDTQFCNISESEIRNQPKRHEGQEPLSPDGFGSEIAHMLEFRNFENSMSTQNAEQRKMLRARTQREARDNMDVNEILSSDLEFDENPNLKIQHREVHIQPCRDYGSSMISLTDALNKRSDGAKSQSSGFKLPPSNRRV